MRTFLALGLALVATGAGCIDPGDGDDTTTLAREGHHEHGHDHHKAVLHNNVPMRNPSGFATTVSTKGSIDLGNEFFQDLGTNGRRCVSCHLPTAGWTITPSQIQEVFEETDGGAIDDPDGFGAIFRTNDGSNSPDADVSTLEARRSAYSMLLSKGVIRVSMPVPAGAEFDLVTVDDPYGHASADDVSMFRRPLPSTNLGFLSTVMWDGRETIPGASIHLDLSNQSNDATTGHAQGDPIDDAQRESIVDFETALFTTQIFDDEAGNLHSDGARGGPGALTNQEFHIGINDNFGDCIDPDGTGCRVVGAPLGSGTRGAAFDPIVFDIFDAWATAHGGGHNRDRRSIARGQALFNTRLINISGVSGLNDEAVFGSPANIPGTCTTCHNSPNAGDHSVVAPLNIGLAAADLRTPDMPLYTFKCSAVGVANGACATNQTVQVTDPGRAMISGKWKHIGRFKGPILRGLAARAPYFHNGFAADLDEVIDFYDNRFGMGLSVQEHDDLVAFLRSL